MVLSSGGDLEAHTLQRTYTQSVLRAGGVPILLSPVPNDHVADLVDRIDGLVLSGGGDIDVARYGGRTNDAIYETDFDRDEFEIQLVKCIARRRLPTLAICRGLQVINVAMGGTLVEDIPSEIGSMDHSVIGHHVFNGHQHVRLADGCRIARVVETLDLEVNSIHHQAVRRVAPGFRAVGWADDGVVEAIEHDDPDWPLLAVQWHPEYLGETDDRASWSLFHAMVEAAGKRALAL